MPINYNSEDVRALEAQKMLCQLQLEEDKNDMASGGYDVVEAASLLYELRTNDKVNFHRLARRLYLNREGILPYIVSSQKHIMLSYDFLTSAPLIKELGIKRALDDHKIDYKTYKDLVESILVGSNDDLEARTLNATDRATFAELYLSVVTLIRSNNNIINILTNAKKAFKKSTTTEVPQDLQLPQSAGNSPENICDSLENVDTLHKIYNTIDNINIFDDEMIYLGGICQKSRHTSITPLRCMFLLYN